MKKYVFIVMTNAVQGREDEYNTWYTEKHLPDVLRIPGIVGAQRFKLASTQRRDPPYPWQYAALYDIETESLQTTISALKARSGTKDMPLSDAMAEEKLSYIFEPITARVVAKL